MNRSPRLMLFALVCALGLGIVIGRGFPPSAAHAADDGSTPGAGEHAATDATPPPLPPKVVRVIDGRTVEIEYQPTSPVRMLVRLLHVDAPYENQTGHEQPRAALAQLVYGKRVELAYQKPGVIEQDRTCRLLAYIVQDGRNANLEMVRQGAAKFLTRYGEGRLAEQFRAAEAEAREANRGVWASQD